MSYSATIVIPCYNKEKYIVRALDSVVSLSRFEDFEVIIVDDCSRDNSVEIIEEYIQPYANMRLIAFDKGSGSPSKPRNIAIRESTSPYLIFMDPDDQVINDGYSLLLTKMEEFESDILIGTRVGVTEAGVVAFTDYIDDRFTFVNEKSDEIMLDLLNRRPFILKTIYRKSLITDNDIWFNEAISTSEDESFDMRCAAHADRITKINDIVYQYTVESDDSLTTGVRMKVYEDLYAVMMELKEAYGAYFSKEITIDRIVALVEVFYLYRISYLKTPEDISIACNHVHDAFMRFGLSEFDCLVDRHRIDLVKAIADNNMREIVENSFLRRVRTLESRNKKLDKARVKNEAKIDSLKTRLSKAETTLNRKIMQPSLKLARTITSLKHSDDPHLPVSDGVSRNADADASLIAYRSMFDSFIGGLETSPNGYWVFMDRPDNAKDNAEALYRYVKENKIADRLAFILHSDSHDYRRLQEEGFNLIDFGSLEHWRVLYNAEYFFTSHCDMYELTPWYFIEKKRQKKIAKSHPLPINYRLVFLQHGVIRSNLSEWLGSKPFYRFVASSPIEIHSLLSIPHYRLTDQIVRLTGLPRWDYLNDETKPVVAIFPTWRPELTNAKEDEFQQLLESSPFLGNWVDLCSSAVMERIAKHNRVVFYSHHDNMRLLDSLRTMLPSYIEVVSYNDITSFTEIVNTSRMLITDYSSFSFDFLYLEKPVLYFDFERNAQQNNYRGMEYARYGYYYPELDDAQKALELIVDNDYSLGLEYKERIREMLPARDGRHCERVIASL